MKETEANKIVKDYVQTEAPQDWEHREVSQFLYRTYDLAKFTFFSPRDETQLTMPQAVIAVDQMRIEALAAHRLTYNPNGLPFEIRTNSRWIERPRWGLAESLVHEMVHLYQEDGADRYMDRFTGEPLEHCKNGYHNKQFVEMCAEIGLHPLIGIGAHWRPADGQFERLMELMEVEKPAHAYGEFKKPEGNVKGRDADWFAADRGKVRGISTLTLYTSDACTRSSPCRIRAGRRDLILNCGECGGHFLPRI